MIKSYNGLRGIFSIMIFLNHLSYIVVNENGKFLYDNIFHNGAFSVDFFFILSGFCMCLGYANKFNDKISLTQYYNFEKKRLNKIYPIYAITMIAAFIFNLAFRSETSFDIFKNVLFLILGLSMTQSLNVKYYSILNSAGWFISCIFLLYLLSPFIFQKTRKLKNSKKRLIFAGFSLYLVIVALTFLLYFISDNQFISKSNVELILYVTPYIRIIYYLIGIVSALYFMQYTDNIKAALTVRRCSILEIIVVLLAVIAYGCGISIGTANGYTDLIYIPVLSLLIFIFAFDKGIVSKFLTIKPLQYLGNISMEIYLIHYIVINFGGSQIVLKLLGTSDLGIFIGALILLSLTIGLSVISNFIVKKIIYKKGVVK